MFMPSKIFAVAVSSVGLVMASATDVQAQWRRGCWANACVQWAPAPPGGFAGRCLKYQMKRISWSPCAPVRAP
jgi:hypothetical protein